VDCNRLSAGRAFKNPRIEFVWNSVLAEIRGGEEVEGAVLRNLKTNALTEIAVSGVFIYVGMTPKTALLRNKVELSAAGCILTNDRMESSVEGVFAAGDAREKAVRQVVTAASDGAIAAVSAERYLAEMATFREEVLEGSAPVLLAFWEPAARGCIEALARIENSLAPLAARVKLVKIDVSRKNEIARMYGVSAVPSALLLSGGEKIADLSDCLPPGGNLEAGMAAALERGGVNAEAAGTN
jgi:thioredoxin reductase (NADPH)